MITPIAAGLTPAEFISILNASYSGVLVEVYTPATESMTSPELETNINNNLSSSISITGRTGQQMISLINSSFNAYGFTGDEPSSIASSAIEDFIRISFTDESGGTAQHEIWQSKDDAAYELVTTLNAGISSYDYDCALMCGYKFRVRSKKSGVYSIYSSVVTVGAFWPFRTDQSTLDTINFRQIRLDDVSSVSIDWGDGSSYDDYTPAGPEYDVVNHDYAETGIYWIHITGAVDKISVLQFYEQALTGTDVSRWVIKGGSFFSHLFYNGFVGDFSTIIWPTTVNGVHMGGNNDITGSADNLLSVVRSALYDCHIPVGGNGASWILSPYIAHLIIDDGLYGDISGWVYPKNMGYHSWMVKLRGTPTGDISGLFAGDYQYLHDIDIIDLNLDGDLSGWNIIADYDIEPPVVKLNGNNFTKLPRGNFYRFSVYNCAANSCNTAEIDAILAAIDVSVTANAPLYNCAYTLNGVGMGIPSAAGLASKASIEGKYTAAGKTATILVNS